MTTVSCGAAWAAGAWAAAGLLGRLAGGWAGLGLGAAAGGALAAVAGEVSGAFVAFLAKKWEILRWDGCMALRSQASMG